MDKKALVQSIKQMVRSEVRSILSEMDLKEVIESEVNRVLAEKFISSVGSNQRVVAESVNTRRDDAKISAKRKAELLKKMGADTDPMMRMIYEDLDVGSSTAPQRIVNGIKAPISTPTQSSNGMIVDSDDEGFDLSQFGFTQ